MIIIIKENNYELNAVNMHDILSDFNQGHNSGPSMADRVAKFLLSKENMNSLPTIFKDWGSNGI